MVSGCKLICIVRVSMLCSLKGRDRVSVVCAVAWLVVAGGWCLFFCVVVGVVVATKRSNLSIVCKIDFDTKYGDNELPWNAKGQVHECERSAF